MTLASTSRTHTAWDGVHDGRAAFRVCMDAICRPGTPVRGMPRARICAEPVLDRAAAVLLSLLDPGLSLAVDGGPLARGVVAEVLRQTGASPAPVVEADFVLVSGDGGGAAAVAPRGSALRPESGATLVYAGDWPPISALLLGPGIEHPPRAALLALPSGELELLVEAAVSPPAGLDALVVSPLGLTALPRSVLRPGVV